MVESEEINIQVKNSSGNLWYHLVSWEHKQSIFIINSLYLENYSPSLEKQTVAEGAGAVNAIEESGSATLGLLNTALSEE